MTSHVTHHVTVTCGHLRRIHTQLLSAHSPEEEVSKVLVGECSGQQEACQRAVVPPLILEGLKGRMPMTLGMYVGALGSYSPALTVRHRASAHILGALPGSPQLAASALCQHAYCPAV